MSRIVVGVLAAAGTAMSAIFGSFAHSLIAGVILLLGSAATGVSASLAVAGFKKTLLGVPAAWGRRHPKRGTPPDLVLPRPSTELERGASLGSVQPIGAEGLAVEDHTQGRRLRHRLGDATAGSALDCDLARREDARHGGRATPGSCKRGHRRSVTAGTTGLRKRASRPGGGGAPVRASAREGATWPPP